MTTAPRFAILASLAVLLCAVALSARAHPHAWIDLRSAVIFDDEGRVVALREHWLFDQFYTLFAIEDLDRDGDGAPDPDKLTELAAVNIANLKDHDYFTDFTVDGVQVAYAPATDYETFMVGDRLALVFTLPLAEPVDPTQVSIEFAVYDPTYWIEVLHVREEPVLLEGSVPAGCRSTVKGPNPDADAVSLAAALDRTQTAGDGLGLIFAEQVSLRCD